MRPVVKFLGDELLEQIVTEARSILRKPGLEIHNDGILSMLSDHGARVDRDKGRVFLSDDIIDQALGTAPASVKLYDVLGCRTHDLSGHNVYFTPGSAAINVLDDAANSIRTPTTADYIQYVKLVSQLDNIASQSTALIPRDVHQNISDSYRLFLSLMFCKKPVVTGAFTIEAFDIMRDLQLAVRGTREKLEAKPLTIFSCCPTAPLKWSDVTSQNVVDWPGTAFPSSTYRCLCSGSSLPSPWSDRLYSTRRRRSAVWSSVN